MRILLVEHDEPTRNSLVLVLEHLGESVVACGEATRAHDLLDDCNVDAVLCDLELPGEDGFDLSAQVRGARPDIPVILMRSRPEPEEVVRAMRTGVVDFLEKPIRTEALEVALERARTRRSEAERVRPLPGREDGDDRPIAGLPGEDPRFHALFRLVRGAARQACPVLVLGEDGSRRRAVASAIHREGPRAGGPFVALSCAALPPELLDAELFGTPREGDTRAGPTPSPGALARASGGTLFLDEIQAMPEMLQARLVRVLDVGTAPAVEQLDEVPADTRLVAAAPTGGWGAPLRGRILPELAARLSAFSLEVPPLGDETRGSSGPGDRFAGDPATMRVSDGAAGGRLAAPQGVPPSTHSSDVFPVGLDLEAVERLHILRVLGEVDGNRSLAARKLGMNRVTLYRKLKRFGLS